MSDSYILHDVMRKVKADGLFDSVRRDLIADLEQKSSYVELKTSIEQSMSTYLSEHQWSPALKKSDLREKARRHIESSNLIKDNLPAIVNQYMQTCQEQLVQPRLSAFVNDHIEHVYHAIGGTHVYRAPVKKDPPPPAPPVTTPVPPPPPPPSPSPSTKPKTPVKKETPSPNPTKKPVPPKDPTPVKKKLPIVVPPKPEKRTRTLSPIHSPTDLVDVSPSPPSSSITKATPVAAPETISITSTPSPPPPVVRVASPLDANEQDETNGKKKQETSETRRLRPRRPHSKYSKEQFETGDLEIIEPSSPPTASSKSKKFRPLDTPSSPVDRAISPEYGTSPPVPPRSPSPVPSSASPRRLRPRRTHERSAADDSNEPPLTSSKTRKSSSSSSNSLGADANDEASGSRSKSFIWKPKISK